ncbi:MAG: endo-1,4-beta-xylanase [Novosphingobium sp.]|nr:endo-1,4-beta-xylanase [Novosphingobium sp.]
MRRALIAAVASLTVLGSLAATVPAQAAAANPVPATMFGLHVPGIADGVTPTVPYGTLRLWDSGVAWGQVEQSNNQFWWNGLDAAVGNGNMAHANSMIVLGSTPTWAASNKKQGTYPYKGAASMPKKMADWKDWVTAVATRYKGSVGAYQIWNEANLTNYWAGTPKQMADLTKAAYQIIKSIDPSAAVVSASSTVRLTARYNSFFPKYLKALKKQGWPVDAIAIHTYPAGNEGPAARVKYIQKTQADMRKAGVPADRQLWDTEINYGIVGPGKTPGRSIGGADAAAYVAQTYLDNIRLGVSRSYWYFWNAADGRVGIVMNDGTPGAIGFQTVERWLKDKFYSCVTGAVNLCQLGDNTNPEIVAWATTGSGTYTVPAGATVQCNALNQCGAVVPGTTVTIGSMPTWFGTDAINARNQSPSVQ